MQGEIAWAVRHVLANPPRLRYLAAHQLTLPLLKFLRRIVPLAAEELRGIRAAALAIPDERLRTQAVASVQAKAFHVGGACILATFLPAQRAREYVATVAPLESIYDYLDNLCDRHPDVAPAAYPVLHQAIADALDPHRPLHDYYACGPAGSDGGYLRSLVVRTREGLERVDGYAALMLPFSEAAQLYGEMQSLKHLDAAAREPACIDWFSRRRDARSEALSWYEFACAAGSQFQVCAPLYECFAGRSNAAAAAYDAYFPAVASVHVLLDAYIDQREDREYGELNFAAAYPNFARLKERAGMLVQQAQERFAALPVPAEHDFLLRVMALFYLTHPKVYEQGLARQAQSLLREF